jgi:SOS-response transcriptional repressor LexA/DNA-binding XRE family transcriptional regulator
MRNRGSKGKFIRPTWSLKIEHLRHSRKLNQAEFGAQLGLSAMAVSRWERGVAEPHGEIYVRLGNLAGDPLCWFFWKHAGLRLSDVTRVLPEVRRSAGESESSELDFARAGNAPIHSLESVRLVTVPLLPIQAGTPGSRGDNVDLAEVSPESALAAPIEWCPHPESTICLRVKGNSMSPLILDGYVIAVDTSDIENDRLVGHIVVASHQEKGLLVSRLIRFDHTDALVSDHREYESVPVAPGSAWRIIGKVLWWTGRAR